jgi:hypothetical protein
MSSSTYRLDPNAMIRESSDSQDARSRRRRKWIRPDLQLQVVVVTFSIATAVLSVHVLASLATLAGLDASRPRTAAEAALIAQFETIVFRHYGAALLVALPCAIWMGRSFIFRVCGPVHRFHLHFLGLRDGRWDRRLELRKGDDLLDVGNAIASGLDAMTDRLRVLARLLGECRALIESTPALAADGDAARLSARLAAEEAEIARRLGPIDPTEAGGVPRETPGAASPCAVHELA